ncbi:DUF3185 family protein, partial [Microbulbifer mangrovi]|uniref:DUF3185 family protein n=1 Tax=Microbulbifer mangrovi TaxID=927787 RepID=UPI001EFA9D07
PLRTALCDLAVVSADNSVFKFEYGIIMNRKITGIILIVIGVALVAWGYNIYDSAGSQLARALTGDTPIEAWLGMVGGFIAVVIGIKKVK